MEVDRAGHWPKRARPYGSMAPPACSGEARLRIPDGDRSPCCSRPSSRWRRRSASGACASASLTPTRGPTRRSSSTSRWHFCAATSGPCSTTTRGSTCGASRACIFFTTCGARRPACSTPWPTSWPPGARTGCRSSCSVARYRPRSGRQPSSSSSASRDGSGTTQRRWWRRCSWR